MNINVKIRNKRKMVEKEGGILTKCPICLLFIRLNYKIWYQIKVKCLPFNQNYLICEISNLNNHKY